MKTTFLFQYLVHRAKIKGEQINFTQKGIESYFKNGVRTILGVEINEYGFPLYDQQPPIYGDKPGLHFLNNYIYWSLIHIETVE